MLRSEDDSGHSVTFFSSHTRGNQGVNDVSCRMGWRTFLHKNNFIPEGTIVLFIPWQEMASSIYPAEMWLYAHCQVLEDPVSQVHGFSKTPAVSNTC